MTLTPGFYALVGPNAAGKTHYLQSMIGPNAAFVPAGADAAFAGRTVDDHLRAARAVRPVAWFRFPGGRIKDLSVGQRRLLTLEVALGTQAELLLLDEPFDGLDTSARKTLRQRLIDSLAEDPARTVVMASHRPEDFAGLATHVIQVFEREVSAPLLLDDARETFPTITGPAAEIAALAAHHRVVERASLGPTARATFADPAAGEAAAAGASASPAEGALTVSYPDDAELIDLLATTPLTQPPAGAADTAGPTR